MKWLGGLAFSLTGGLIVSVLFVLPARLPPAGAPGSSTLDHLPNGAVLVRIRPRGRGRTLRRRAGDGRLGEPAADLLVHSGGHDGARPLTAGAPGADARHGRSAAGLAACRALEQGAVSGGRHAVP